MTINCAIFSWSDNVLKVLSTQALAAGSPLLLVKDEARMKQLKIMAHIFFIVKTIETTIYIIRTADCLKACEEVLKGMLLFEPVFKVSWIATVMLRCALLLYAQ